MDRLAVLPLMEMPMALERLQKIIARAGVTSRRKAEELITQGLVSVNGEVIRELGTKAESATDHIKVNGKLIRPPTRLVYLALHKPRGYVTTRSDPEGRPTVMDLLKGVKDRVYPVGRLDYQTEGLLFLTNDGEFANRVTAASSGILKTYQVKVKGLPPEKDLERLRQGILLDGERTLPARIRMLRTAERVTDRSPNDHPPRKPERGLRSGPRADFKSNSAAKQEDDSRGNSWHEVVLSQGRQNQIRRMFSLIGYPVQKLKRVKIGPILLGELRSGKLRHLTPTEVSLLMPQHSAPDSRSPIRESQPRVQTRHSRAVANSRDRKPKSRDNG